MAEGGACVWRGGGGGGKLTGWMGTVWGVTKGCSRGSRTRHTISTSLPRPNIASSNHMMLHKTSFSRVTVGP